MIKGKEGIALVLAIVFMLAITILLTAVLLLSTQEINATQLYLDGNKAFYYAEAGVEYAQARILKAMESDRVSQDIDIIGIKNSVSTLEIFNDNNIKGIPSLSIVESSKGLFSVTYSISCSVSYGKAYRKVTKTIQFLDGRLDKAVASKGNIEFKVNPGQDAKINIDGDIYAQSGINFEGNWKKGGFNLNGVAYASSVKGYDLPVEPPGNFTFPNVNITSYRSQAKYYVGTNPPNSPNLVKSFRTVDDFLGAFNDPNSPPPQDGIVYIDVDFHINNIKDISSKLKGLIFVVNGELSHANNITNITLESENSVIEFIAKKVYINGVNTSNKDDFEVRLKNFVIYATEELRFNNIKNFIIDGGGLYLAPASDSDNSDSDKKKEIDVSLDLDNIKSNFRVISIPEAQKQKGAENYFLVSWSDAGI